ncbi:hypothetical protein ESY86_19570 [Subsaximicrobium wynnwilliamsii]|uniref:Uncharacterized protein n=1 Tax=Subsaximicrobium wynnwilliamsii TaxID=291179 RepID=A0A5C6ZCG1_9FLAO|nr:hypothetical protein [Subsaximicrobium wynnwilliamsii]TXD80999.1 hypothetical protein ESY87_19640 [Subsaximicrobium wynnwilliamsii]TXD86690.1 hypothetical protein ESY86_19570 [Subsaximicrobium wynnwilliamsii]TXE00333.1 hypothetical protein ESY88_19630 [Subsaximicrobium wynnwilliamsii]
MKKILFILLCSFVSFGFTNERIEPISENESAEITLPVKVETYNFPYENGTITLTIFDNGICEQGTVTGTLSTHCDDDGIADYVWSGTICREHIDALIMQFNASC